MNFRAGSHAVFALLLLAAGVLSSSADSRGRTIFPEGLNCGTAYPIVVRKHQARLELSGQKSGRYALIVSSFGHESQKATVTLQARPLERSRGMQVAAETPLPERAIPPAGLSVQTSRIASRPNSVCRNSSIPPAVREFHLHVTDGPLDEARHYTRLAANLTGYGSEVEVYLDAQQSPAELSPDVVPEIVRLFDKELIPEFRRTLADFRDVDGNGRFTVFLTPWLSRLQGGKTSLGGFVRGTDFRSDQPAPFSNRCDMLYLNSSVTAGPHLKSLLAHEFAHAICFSHRLPSAQCPHGLPDDEDWLNEAIAHVAENIYGHGWSNLDYRISRFLLAPQDAPLVVNDYYRAGRWRDHGCRGATYLFLRWCVDQFGEQLLAEVVQSPCTGTRNLETATGMPFDELYRHWTLAVLRESEADGRAASRSPHGFRSVDLHGRMGSWQLAGPRCLKWQPGTPPMTVSLQGTSTAYIEIEAAPDGRACEIQIASENAERLQVTLMVLPDVPSRPHFAANWDWDDSTRDGLPRKLTLRGMFPAGNWDIRSISCERHDGDRRASHVWGRENLPQPILTGPVDDGGAEQAALTLAIPDALLQEWNSGELWMKIVAEHGDGQRSIEQLRIEVPPPRLRQFAARP